MGRTSQVFIADPLDEGRLGKFDSIVEVPVILDQGEHQVNEKKVFSSIFTKEPVADLEVVALAFKTPAGTKRIHLIGEFTTLTGGVLDLIEGVAWDAETGTTNAILNRFREAVPQPSAMLENQGQASFEASNKVIVNPDNLAGGTILSSFRAFGEKNRFSGAGYAIAKWILKPDTQYVCKFTSTAAANAAQVSILWNEHTDE